MFYDYCLEGSSPYAFYRSSLLSKQLFAYLLISCLHNNQRSTTIKSSKISLAEFQLSHETMLLDDDNLERDGEKFL